MSYKPPFARMRTIKRNAAVTRKPAAPAQPASVTEALAELTEKPVSEEPAAPVETVDTTPESENVEPNMDMKRSELNAIAEEVGVESPDKLPNKQAVLDAIVEAQGEAE